MKKLSTIIALALVLTIGGVFAAWHYSTGKVDKLGIGPGLQMTTVEVHSESAQGVINQMAVHSFTFRVDDKYDYLANDGDDLTNPTDADKYVAMLVTTGQWQIKFTPDEHANMDVANNGVDLLVTVDVEEGTQYLGQTIITEKTGANTFVIGKTLDVITITSQQIEDCLDFVQGVVLDTPEKNTNFANALKNYVINITVTQANV